MPLRNQSQLFSHLYGLGSSSGAQLIEEPAGVGLYCVFADEELFGDLAVAQAVGNQFQNFQLARSDAEFAQSGLVQSKRPWRRNLSNYYCFLVLGEPKSEPDAQPGEEQ